MMLSCYQICNYQTNIMMYKKLHNMCSNVIHVFLEPAIPQDGLTVPGPRRGVCSEDGIPADPAPAATNKRSYVKTDRRPT
jgi:hypothetical protein